MSKRGLKILLLISVAVIIIMLGIIICLLFFRKDDTDKILGSVYLNNGDNLNELSLSDAFGNEIAEIPFSHDLNLVVYLSDTCAGCLAAMESMRDIMGVFGEEELGYAFVYLNSIPRNAEEKYGIPKEHSYRINNNIMIASTLPTFYLADNTGKILFQVDEEELIIQKLISTLPFSQQELIEQANQYIVSAYFDADSSKEKLIYFAMEGCSDCEAADAIINTEEVQEKYDVVRIYTYRTENEELIVDKMQLFRYVYNLAWYPSFEIIGNDGSEFIGEVSIEELETILKD